MKNLKINSPLFAGVFAIVAMLVYYAVCYIFSFKFGYFDIEEIGVTEVITYLFYGFAGGVLFSYAKDYLKTSEQNTFFLTIFLFVVAMFREMGIQHWLTTHDTVITKSRFFTNPNNPLYEKLIAGSLMIIVLLVVLYLAIKYIKPFFKGLIKFNPISWTIFSMSILTFITQIADRFPANYFKATGMEICQHQAFVLKILEEGGESLLPLLLVVLILQWHNAKHID